MIGILENDSINVYSENTELFGALKVQDNFTKATLHFGKRKCELRRSKWDLTVFENDKVILNLKTNFFCGNTQIIETGYKITGVPGLKWGTKLVDLDNNTLVRIRNENQLVNRNKYQIEVLNKKTSAFDVLITLFGHLQGSSMKQMATIIG